MTNIWQNFAQYIIDNYSDSDKIIEVGIGKIYNVADILKNRLPNTTIKLIDLYPSRDDILRDDITNPTDEYYQDANLIYSIRPPEELQKDITQLANQYNSNVIIKPLMTEEINYNLQTRFKLVNYKSISFYELNIGNE
ncbi:MAG: hypothetical protein LUG89_05375 [Methanosphaera sp.]|nr:hypothetical protein [Methanosphaera sp.]